MLLLLADYKKADLKWSGYFINPLPGKMSNLRIALLVVFLLPCFSLFAQLQLSGKLVDTLTQEPLPYVNIGIKIKNKGTTSLADSSFSMPFPQELVEDTLTFSLVGYHSLDLPIKQMLAKKEIIIRLRQKTTQLAPVNITAEKLVEKKYGIKKRNLLLHFTDGMFDSNDIVEIGQLIKLGNRPAQITSLNLHLNASRTDSATFRTNFLQA